MKGIGQSRASAISWRLFEDAYAAWFWLTTPRNALDGEEPLTVLARGQRDRVVAAAEGHLQGDFA